MADRQEKDQKDKDAGKPAPVANQESTIRDAKFPDEKPHPDTVAQVEEILEP